MSKPTPGVYRQMFRFTLMLAALGACQHHGGGGGGSTPAPTPVGTGVGPFMGNATHFDALGDPTGACGIADDTLETQNFVALNVQNTPGVYSTNLPRPIVDAASVGAFNNGLNCGRWVQVTLGDYCTGDNDGAENAGFCHGATATPWVEDANNGGTLTMIVADSCQDGNGWCRDDPYHLDLATSALSAFTKNGQPLGSLLPDHWGNRQITWQYVAAPNYQGDLQIGFYNGSQQYWIALVINQLQNGLHGVEVMVNGVWQKATMMSDNGQVYILPQGSASPYHIRVYDANDQLIQNGRVYVVPFPAACGSTCSATYTKAEYTVQ